MSRAVNVQCSYAENLCSAAPSSMAVVALHSHSSEMKRDPILGANLKGFNDCICNYNDVVPHRETSRGFVGPLVQFKVAFKAD